jgi:hypothetical protein
MIIPESFVCKADLFQMRWRLEVKGLRKTKGDASLKSSFAFAQPFADYRERLAL